MLCACGSLAGSHGDGCDLAIASTMPIEQVEEVNEPRLRISSDEVNDVCRLCSSLDESSGYDFHKHKDTFLWRMGMCRTVVRYLFSDAYLFK